MSAQAVLKVPPVPALEEMSLRVAGDEAVPQIASVEVLDDPERRVHAPGATRASSGNSCFETPRVSPQKLMNCAHRRSTKRFMLLNWTAVTNVHVTPEP